MLATLKGLLDDPTRPMQDNPLAREPVIPRLAVDIWEGFGLCTRDFNGNLTAADMDYVLTELLGIVSVSERIAWMGVWREMNAKAREKYDAIKVTETPDG